MLNAAPIFELACLISNILSSMSLHSVDSSATACESKALRRRVSYTLYDITPR